MRVNKLDNIPGKASVLLAMSLFFTLMACAPREAPQPVTKLVEKPEVPPVEARVPWQQEWENLIKAAQKEGVITIYGSLIPVQSQALRKHFGEKYNVKTEVVSGKSGELEAKISIERAAGLHVPDVYIEGPTSPLLVWKPKKVLLPLDKIVFRPDVLDEKIWWGGYGPFFDKDHYLVAGSRGVLPEIVIDKNQVSAAELTSYNELLNPRWKKKIVMRDPTIGGAGQVIMTAALQIMGEDYIKKLAEQVDVIMDDSRLLVEWVARGRYPVAFGSGTSMVYDFIRAGATNLELIALKEGSRVLATSTVVLFDRAPHPSAAKLFINWILTQEAQHMFALSAGRTSRRLDVSDEHVLPVERMKEGIRYLPSDEEFYLNQPKYAEIIKKYYRRQ